MHPARFGTERTEWLPKTLQDASRAHLREGQHRQANWQKDSETDRHRQTNRQTDRQTERQSNRQTINIQTRRQTGRETERDRARYIQQQIQLSERHATKQKKT